MRFFFVPLFLAAALLCRAQSPELPDYLAGVPAPLALAVQKMAHDVNRWAYTQHNINFDKNGNVDDEEVARFDPSQHYDEQWTLISRNGKPASEDDVAKYRRKRAKRSAKRQTLGELLELKQAAVAEETADRVVYDVPLRKQNNDRLPPEKFAIRISVRKPDSVFERIDLTLRSPMRVALIAKVKQGGASLRFDTVDPKHAPPLVGIDAAGSFSVMMMSLNETYKLVRTDFKRVKPFDERFGVTIGPMKVIDF